MRLCSCCSSTSWKRKMKIAASSEPSNKHNSTCRWVCPRRSNLSVKPSLSVASHVRRNLSARSEDLCCKTGTSPFGASLRRRLASCAFPRVLLTFGFGDAILFNRCIATWIPVSVTDSDHSEVELRLR
ncbi:unnamed protein product [Amoebophrya sp. A120]|nr:unnamed protein product [Amoebophrya sp. A120]|eukprot:GSA120T00020001001.1